MERRSSADFGLAIHEDAQQRRAGEIAGTPSYMAPEQVRGETHRLDGRTDVWALGVILYQGLCGRMPFRSATRESLFDEILNREPKPARQVNDHVPRELERISLKCLAKRMSDRYATARDLAGDLQLWLAQAVSTSPVKPDSTIAVGGQSWRDVRVVPKGLRAYECEDADFFLSLLPGPRDRDGLPESIRAWKTRIEATTPDRAVPVGLIYGASGCGKSSLVKAGLLPRLAPFVKPVYVEAAADDTEGRLLAALRRHLLVLAHGLRPGRHRRRHPRGPNRAQRRQGAARHRSVRAVAVRPRGGIEFRAGPGDPPVRRPPPAGALAGTGRFLDGDHPVHAGDRGADLGGRQLGGGRAVRQGARTAGCWSSWGGPTTGSTKPRRPVPRLASFSVAPSPSSPGREAGSSRCG